MPLLGIMVFKRPMTPSADWVSNKKIKLYSIISCPDNLPSTYNVVREEDIEEN
jgi:hypothetical protein